MHKIRLFFCIAIALVVGAGAGFWWRADAQYPQPSSPWAPDPRCILQTPSLFGTVIAATGSELVFRNKDGNVRMVNVRKRLPNCTGDVIVEFGPY
jgi:hypothetical protein